MSTEPFEQTIRAIYWSVVAVAILLAGCVNVQAVELGPEEDVDAVSTVGGSDCGSATARRVVHYVNQERRGRDLEMLACSRRLTRLAQAHADDMCDRGYVGHVSSDGVGMADRFEQLDVRYTAIAENVAAGQPSAFRAHDGWMHSPGHRRNILHPALRRIGVGYASCGGQPRWVQVFSSHPR